MKQYLHLDRVEVKKTKINFHVSIPTKYDSDDRMMTEVLLKLVLMGVSPNVINQFIEAEKLSTEQFALISSHTRTSLNNASDLHWVLRDTLSRVKAKTKKID